MCKNKLHVCTYSTIRFNLKFVNLFIEVSRVCGVTDFPIPALPSKIYPCHRFLIARLARSDPRNSFVVSVGNDHSFQYYENIKKIS